MRLASSRLTLVESVIEHIAVERPAPLSSHSPMRGNPTWRWLDSFQTLTITRGHFLQALAMQSTNISPMLYQQNTHQWLGRFAVRLMQLRQNISLPAAVARAVRAYAHSSEMLPEAAAQLDAAVSAWRLPPTPRAYATARQPANKHPVVARERVRTA